MKTQLLSTALILALSGPVFATETKTDGHSEMKVDGHGEMKKDDHGEMKADGHGEMKADGHGDMKAEGHGEMADHGGDHMEMAAGKPGMADQVSRTVKVSMIETDDGDMIFEPRSLNIKAGETIRFAIQNTGELEHEFVLDTMAENAEHKEMMMESPEMAHKSPNSLRLDVGQSGEIIWSFSNPGSFEFACLIPGHYELGMHSAVTVADTMAAEDTMAAAEISYTKGVVKKINAKSGKVTIIHEPLTNLGMPAMTMIFRVSEKAMLERMKAGDKIEFVADRVKGKLVVSVLK